MKCVICQGSDISLTQVSEELKVVNDIVFVPVEVLVCHTCGERYYDRQTIRFLEKVERELKQGKTGLQEVGKVLVYA